MFHEMIAQCAENFGKTPRRFSLWDRLTYLRVVRPEWLYQSPNDELETLFLNLAKLKRDGRVVWGHFIQANSELFAPGKDDQPGDIVYSLDDAATVSVDELGEVAAALAALKHTKPEVPGLALIANHLTDEYTRVFGKRVPSAISPKLPCRMSTIYVVRKHLPNPKPHLRAPLLPIIVNPTEPHVALVLPSRYWPEPLLEWWKGPH